jgi:arylsulfatase A-like enzyme
MPSFQARFRRALLTLWGAAPLALLLPAYKLWLVLESQVGVPRALATFGVLAALTAIACAPLAALWAWLPVGRRPGRLAAVWPFWLTLGSGWLLGMTVFYLHPRLAPAPILVGTGLAAIALAVAFWRKPEEEQRLVAGMLLAGGRLVLVAPWLGLPWVVADVVADRPLPVVAAPGTAAAPGAPKRIVLITFDAMRARSTSLHTPALGNTPHLAALAREATWYTRCHAVADRTQVTMPALLSGRDPQAIFARIDNRLGHLREGRVTGLAGYLKPAGYQAYFAGMLLAPEAFGMGDEFAGSRVHARFVHPNEFNVRSYVPLGEVFDWARRQVGSGGRDFAPEDDHVRAARRTFDDARETLRAHPGRTFVWVHVGVPHDPYYDVPAADLGGALHPERYRRVTAAMLNSKDRYSPEFERIYERYVAFGDAELGRFMAGLKADGLWHDTMVIVTADHGQQFGVGKRPHGGGVAPEDIAHVPLLIRTPGQAEARRVDGHVGHLDLVPTVLAQVYGRSAEGLAGRPLGAGPVPADRVVFTWAGFGRFSRQDVHRRQPQTIAAYQGRYKYTVERVGGARALYDLQVDPRETTDLKARHPAVLRRLEAATEQAYGR